MSDHFTRFIAALTLAELVILARDLRKYPEDKEQLFRVLKEISRRGAG